MSALRFIRHSAFAAIALTACSTTTKNPATGAGQTLADGQYVGREPLPSLSPDEPGAAWFHENTLTIRGTHAVIEKIPITIKGGKTLYSASDGGFINYEGPVEHKGEHPILRMRVTLCDYVDVAQKKVNWEVTRQKDGSLRIDDVTYRSKKD